MPSVSFNSLHSYNLERDVGKRVPVSIARTRIGGHRYGALSLDWSFGLIPMSLAKSKKQRRLAAKAARALDSGSHGSSQAVQVPLEEQSIDLPAGMGGAEGQEALNAREGLTSAMRSARRKMIKESNYLKGMR